MVVCSTNTESQNGKGECKVRESGFGSIYESRGTGADPTLKLTDFKIFRELSTLVRNAHFADGRLRAEPEARHPPEVLRPKAPTVGNTARVRRSRAVSDPFKYMPGKRKRSLADAALSVGMSTVAGGLTVAYSSTSS